MAHKKIITKCGIYRRDFTQVYTLQEAHDLRSNVGFFLIGKYLNHTRGGAWLVNYNGIIWV